MVCIKEIKTGEVTRVPNEEAVKKVKTEKFRLPLVQTLGVDGENATWLAI